MKKLSRWIYSPKLALVLLIVFALAMAVATFIENDFGTSTAWKLVYNAWWFELVMILLTLSFTANIFTYRLWRKEKLSILLFHLAFIVIILGAGITRYASYGGVMRIREGQKSSTIISDQNYLTAKFVGEKKTKVLRKELSFSPLVNNDFIIEDDFEGKSLEISFEKFVADAAPAIRPPDEQETGSPILELVVSKGNGRESIFLQDGEIQELNKNIRLSLNREDSGAINIWVSNDRLFVRSPVPLSYFVMGSQEAGTIQANNSSDFNLRTLYRFGDLSFVPLVYHPDGVVDLVSTAEKPKDNDEVKDDVLVVNLKVDEEVETVHLLYRQGFLPLVRELELGGIHVDLSYGSKAIEIPFEVKLEDFQLERYPGSESPSSYASEVRVIDGEQGYPYRIYMNNVLDHRGFRFYQASYDTDELGTVLAVNHDRPGTLVSYLGYLLMGLGMCWTLFGRNSRFAELNSKLKKLKLAKAAGVILLFFMATPLSADTEDSKVLEKLKELSIDPLHADRFGKLMVQDLDGRIKPLNTLGSEFVRKISRRTRYDYSNGDSRFEMNSDQLFLSLHVNPESWKDIPLIKISPRKLGDLSERLFPSSLNLITFNALVDVDGSYIIQKDVEAANAKKPAERNEYDKEILLVDERFNILYNVFLGNYLKVFPLRDDDSRTWYSYSHDFSNFPAEDRQFVTNIMPVYFNDISKGNWDAAEKNLEYIRLYQQVLGEDIIPVSTRIKAELLYNRLNINFWLFQLLWILGFVLLVFAIIHIFREDKWVRRSLQVLNILVAATFLLFTFNLILRWYIAQHAPWSNGYEMIVFVSWVLLLCGLLTWSKSDFTIPLAALFSGTLMFVSYLDWLNPEITNLMPVLKSYWLKIHVATIVSSYAPLALSAILGIMVLFLIIFKNPGNADRFDLRIKELTYINEISMTIGLFLLAVGTFLGGIWANESWGRYWAWDPKETWALISVIIYAAVLHLRFIPKLRSALVLNIASIFAFSSIVMTSFGVNYYLSGLHSYAAGDPLPIPNFIYVIVFAIITLSLAAWFRNRKQLTINN